MERIKSMPLILTKSGALELEGIGLVRVRLCANSRSVRARWQKGLLTVTAPVGIPLDSLHNILLGMMPKLQARKRAPLYSVGQELQFPEFGVSIREQGFSPEKVIVQWTGTRLSILVGSGCDLASARVIDRISKSILAVAHQLAMGVLIPRATEVAQRVGKSPRLWQISRGKRTLGRCSSTGVISLSSVLMLYPEHLRDYVICHELAHLTEMNHSPRFHKLCDAYCQGREADLRSELRRWRLPIA